MKIINFKRKCMIVSLALILTGGLITAAGFGAAGFNYEMVKERCTNAAWYQTIHTNGDKLWYGIDLGNNIHIFSIGYSE
jgi:hypothetical protein